MAALPMMLRAGLLSLSFTIGPQFVVRFLSFYQHLDRLRQEHTPFRHWYLLLLGVDPGTRARPRHGPADSDAHSTGP